MVEPTHLKPPPRGFLNNANQPNSTKFQQIRPRTLAFCLASEVFGGTWGPHASTRDTLPQFLEICWKPTVVTPNLLQFFGVKSAGQKRKTDGWSIRTLIYNHIFKSDFLDLYIFVKVFYVVNLFLCDLVHLRIGNSEKTLSDVNSALLGPALKNGRGFR